MPTICASNVCPGNSLMLNKGNLPRPHNVVDVKQTSGALRMIQVPTTTRVYYTECEMDENGEEVYKRYYYNKHDTKLVESFTTPKMAITYETGKLTATGKAKTCTHFLPLDHSVVVA